MLQVLTNENGGNATLEILGSPMIVQSFYISNPNKVPLHMPNCQAFAHPAAAQLCGTQI